MKTVQVRNITIGEGRPKICVPIVGQTKEDILLEAGTFDGHFLSDGVNVVVFKCCHKSDAICDVACKMAVIIDDGVYSTAHFCCR